MEVVFVTTNPGKMWEATEIGKEFGIKFVQDKAAVDEVQSADLEEIAAKCAKDAWAQVKKPLIVDDSGVFVEALKGFPGPYSSYVYTTIGVDGVLKLLEGVKNRKALMRSVVAYTDGKTVTTFTGEVDGKIITEKRGKGGFGYDPVFVPAGAEKTFSEDDDYKMQVSHRARSIREFCEWVSKR